MSGRKPVWEEQAVNTDNTEVVADPVLSSCMSSLAPGPSWPHWSQARDAGAPTAPPLLATPSWGRGFAESRFAVLSRCANIINNEKHQAGVYYFAVIYAFGVF